MNRLRFYGYLALSTFAESVSRSSWFRRIWRRQYTHHQSAVLALIGLVFGFGLPVEPASADTFGSGMNSFEIEFITIGSPGNPPDANPNPAGAVPYAYRIGTYEISEQMIDKANALGGLGITKDTRGSHKPATSVNWFEAARFVNWLNTSTGNTPAYKFDGSGNFQLWQPSDPGYNPANLYRNRLAKYFLPSLHEWHKAAYYDPIAGVYYDYPTGSDLVPDGVDFVGDPNFDAVFDDSGMNPEPNNITDTGLVSPYGVVGQGGNVFEWEETAFDRNNNDANDHRSIVGGSWATLANVLKADHTGGGVTPSFAGNFVGFRIARVIPETSTLVLAAIALISVFGLRIRRSKWRSKWVRTILKNRFASSIHRRTRWAFLSTFRTRKFPGNWHNLKRTVVSLAGQQAVGASSRIATLIVGLILCISPFAGSARAAVIYSQATPSSPNGAYSSNDTGNPTDQKIADNFLFEGSGPRVIRSLRFIGGYGVRNPPPSTPPLDSLPLDDFRVIFSTDSAGAPGLPLVGGDFHLGAPVRRIPTGGPLLNAVETPLNYVLDLSQGITVSPSTVYWISIVNNPGTNFSWAWARSAGGFDQNVAGTLGDITSGPWEISRSGGMFFELSDNNVPEPGFLEILLAGSCSFSRIRLSRRSKH